MTSGLASVGGVPVRDRFLPFAVPHIGDEEKREVMEVLDSGWITTGPRVQRFEEALAQYTGAKHVVCLDSGTAALHLSLVALRLEPGDEVITSPLTFCSTVNSILHAGGKPVLADVDPQTLNMSPQAVEAATTPKTKAILPVHYGGQACDMGELLAYAKNKNLRIIEDAAHAVGAKYGDAMIGSLGDATCFSFYANKNLTTAEGGALLTDNDAWARDARLNALHGMSQDAWNRYSQAGSWYYEVVSAGFKCNMTDIAAAMGIHQLAKLDGFIEKRRMLAKQCDEAFSNCDFLKPLGEQPGRFHAYHLYVIQLNLEALSIDRDQFIEELKAEGIGTTVNFIPIHYHPYYRETLEVPEGSLPVTEEAYPRLISLPLYPKMSPEDVSDVVAAVRKIGSAFTR